jgi:hypothetical protein
MVSTHLFQMRGDPFNEIHGALFTSTVAKELLRVDTLPRADERARVCPDLLIIEQGPAGHRTSSTRASC